MAEKCTQDKIEVPFGGFILKTEDVQWVAGGHLDKTKRWYARYECPKCKRRKDLPPSVWSQEEKALWYRDHILIREGLGAPCEEIDLPWDRR